MSNSAIIKKLNELGYTTISEAFYTKTHEWKTWYEGKVKGFHNFRVRNGERMVNCKRYSLGMAKKLCEDWANLLMNEKVHVTLEGEKEQKFVDRVFEANNFTVKANEMQEMKSATGTAAYLPRVVGQETNDGGEAIPGSAEGIVLDYVTAEHIFPLAWENGIISECAFTSVVTRGGHDYLYMQIHHKDTSGRYLIENRVFRYDNEVIADEELGNVRGFEHIPPVIHTGSDKRQFIIDRLNIANNVDYQIPMGISVYANAVDVLQGVDIAYDSYVNEFVLGKRRIMVKPAANRYLDGEPVFDPADVAFYVLPEDVSEGAIIQPIDMALRTQEHNTGIQDQLNILSSKCGLGENYYRFDGGSIATATQVISENSTMFRTIKKHEVILEAVLVELCRTILRLGNMAMNAGLNEDVEISVDFDDSIIENREQEEARIYQMLNAGLMRADEARSLLMNEDIETARKALPGMEDMVDEGQNEIE